MPWHRENCADSQLLTPETAHLSCYVVPSSFSWYAKPRILVNWGHLTLASRTGLLILWSDTAKKRSDAAVHVHAVVGYRFDSVVAHWILPGLLENGWSFPR